jgi:hypothetical protein
MISFIQKSEKENTKMEDPTTKYSRPPFKSQSQPWPGLEARSWRSQL